MPSLVIKLANPYVAGLILAAPYGAVLSTVSGWLLIVSSGLVRDLYQRFLRPTASEREIAWASYAATVRSAWSSAVVALSPPKYLQLIIVFSSTGMASAFLMPALLGCFWRRTTATGAIAAMVDRHRRRRSASTCSARSAPTALGLAWLFGPTPDDRPAQGRSGPTTCSASTRASGACSSSLLGRRARQPAVTAARPRAGRPAVRRSSPPTPPRPRRSTCTPSCTIGSRRIVV